MKNVNFVCIEFSSFWDCELEKKFLGSTLDLWSYVNCQLEIPYIFKVTKVPVPNDVFYLPNFKSLQTEIFTFEILWFIFISIFE